MGIGCKDALARAGPEAPAFTRRESHLHATSPRRPAPPRSPRVHAAGASPSTYVPAPRHREGRAFTRRESHRQPTSPRRAAEKPPRSRGGSLTFHLRPRAAPPRSPRVHAAGASPSTYVPAPRHREAAVFTRREPRFYPTSRRYPAENRPPRPRPECLLSRVCSPAPRRREANAPSETRVSGLRRRRYPAENRSPPPRPECLLSRPPRPECLLSTEKPPRSRGGSLTITLRRLRTQPEKPPRSRGGSVTFTLRSGIRCQASGFRQRKPPPPPRPECLLSQVRREIRVEPGECLVVGIEPR